MRIPEGYTILSIPNAESININNSNNMYTYASDCPPIIDTEYNITIRTKEIDTIYKTLSSNFMLDVDVLILVKEKES